MDKGIELQEFSIDVDVYDPWADKEEVAHEYGIDLVDTPRKGAYDAVVLAVAHKEFLGGNIDSWKKDQSAVFDVKGILPMDQVDKRL